MTAQQTAYYMMRQQQRQNAMRAFLAHAAGGEGRKDPVPPVPPPPPPPETRHVSLSAVEDGALLGAMVSLQEYSQGGEPGREVYSDYSVETDISAGNTVRANVTYVHQTGSTAHVIDRILVNGVEKQWQYTPGLFNWVYVDLTPDSDRTDVVAEYRR